MKDASIPVTLIAVGLGWLLWELRLFPDVDWIISLGFIAAGIAVMAIDGINKNSVVIGPFLIAIGLGQETDVQSLGWLYVYGVVRLLITGFMTDLEPDDLRTLTRTGRIHMLLAGTAFASIAVAASHLDWTGKADVLAPLGWLVTATAIATVTALVVPAIRRVAFGLIERLFYAASLTWLVAVAASIL